MYSQEALKKYGGVFWIDSSVRFYNGNFSRIFDAALENGGFYMMMPLPIPNYVTTASGMYRYLPADVGKQKLLSGFGEANALLIHNTRELYWNVLHWWYLCALTEDCVTSDGRLACRDLVHHIAKKTWAQCHRFDQSALNILVPNYYGYESDRYMPDIVSPGHPIAIMRWPTDMYRIQVCPA